MCGTCCECLQVMLLGDSGVGKTCLLVRFRDGLFLSGNFISTVGIDFRNKVVVVDQSKVKLQIWDTAGQERFRSVTHAYYRDAHALLLLYDVTNKTSFDNIRAWLGEIREYAQDDVVIMLLGKKLQNVDLHGVRNVSLSFISCKILFIVVTLPVYGVTWVRTPDHQYRYWRATIEPRLLGLINRVGSPRGQLSRERILDFLIQAPHVVTLAILCPGNKADCGSERLVRKEEGERLAREYNVTFMETSARTGMNVELTFMAVAKDLKSRKCAGNSDEAKFNVQDYVREQAQRGSCPPCNT
uniref:Ras-related protein Rab-37 n=1 Tax=Timema tahoe TaxID=61484 RepID=A0A7R9IGB1_9NEOP|nr:unnamed protein product [Timema tahoe]